MDNTENIKNLVHCIYTSVGTVEFSPDDIATLLEKARKNNAELGVTGMLLYDKGSFFQVLEGETDVVASLLEKIQRDKRHDRVAKIVYETIEGRNFSEWTMGYSGVTRIELESIEGLNDFFKSDLHFINLDKGRSKTLLKAFKDGKWRASIS